MNLKIGFERFGRRSSSWIRPSWGSILNLGDAYVVAMKKDTNNTNNKFKLDGFPIFPIFCGNATFFFLLGTRDRWRMARWSWVWNKFASSTSDCARPFLSLLSSMTLRRWPGQSCWGKQRHGSKNAQGFSQFFCLSFASGFLVFVVFVCFFRVSMIVVIFCFCTFLVSCFVGVWGFLASWLFWFLWFLSSRLKLLLWFSWLLGFCRFCSFYGF